MEAHISVETAHKRLRNAGYRVTKQRAAIYEYLLSTDVHPTAETIHHSVRRQLPGISLATVYKAVDSLIDVRQINRIQRGTPHTTPCRTGLQRPSKSSTSVSNTSAIAPTAAARNSNWRRATHRVSTSSLYSNHQPRSVRSLPVTIRGQYEDRYLLRFNYRKYGNGG